MSALSRSHSIVSLHEDGADFRGERFIWYEIGIGQMRLMPQSDRAYGNCCGFASILLLSGVVTAIRSVSEAFGAEEGAALLYTASALMLLILLGLPRFRNCSPWYLLSASALFVGYEVCFSLSIGYAQNRHQALEIGAINYLWPCFTVLVAVLMNNERPSWLIVPGSLCALVGVAWVIAGEGSFDPVRVWENVQSNPVSYALAFCGAILWALYCNLTRRFADGQNMIAFFFALTAAVLWVRLGLNGNSFVVLRPSGLLMLVAAGATMAGGYALWNIAMLRGNMTLLAVSSYFIPVLSTALASLLLSTALNWRFWQGVVLVTAGSMLSALATRKKRTSSTLESS